MSQIVNGTKNTSPLQSTVKQIIKEGQEDSFYVLDLADLSRKHENWLKLLPRVHPYYAVKCNGHPAILKFLARLGANFDCASEAEMSQVLSLGVPPDRILYTHPHKVPSHIKYASAHKIQTLVFDSEHELRKIEKIYPDAQLLLRIRSDVANPDPSLLGVKFGTSPGHAERLLKIAKLLKINVVGVCFHAGTPDNKQPGAFRTLIKQSKEIFDLSRDLGFDFNLLDIGGGFPGQKGVSIESYANQINSALAEFFPENSKIRIVSEPGQYYVCSSMVLVSNVHSIKKIMVSDAVHMMYYLNDSIHKSFGIIDRYKIHKVVPIPLKKFYELSDGVKSGDSNNLVSSSFWGWTCDSHDGILEHVLLPPLEIGSWVVFENMGAYTLPVLTSFNTFPDPQVHIINSDS